jgi:hypothetical protein
LLTLFCTAARLAEDQVLIAGVQPKKWAEKRCREKARRKKSQAQKNQG